MSDLTMKYNPAFLDDETLIRTFVVRHREFASVMEVIRENTDDANQHLLVIGPRGSGKSTLVLRAAAEVRRDAVLRERWYPVVYGEESYLVTSAGEFWLEALLQVADQTDEDRWRQAHAELLGERDSDRLARRALAQLMDFADERGVRLLLVVENLHQLVGRQMDHDDETWALRRTLQTEPRVMLLGTATRRFDQIDDRKQALFEFFRILDLDPLDSLDEIGQLWELAGNTDTPRGFLRPVEILTGGNPRLIRILSEFAARTSFRKLMENLVHLMDENTEYFKHHLDKLAPKERKVFVALADRWDPGTARDIAEVARMDVNLASAQLKRLEDRGAVHVVGQQGRAKKYQVTERLYNVYHLMRRRGQASARVKGAVRFMVGYYEGDRLVPAVRALVQEAGGLTPEGRRNHYLAYAEVLKVSEPTLRSRIVAETWEEMSAMPDLPDDLRQRVEAEANPYASLPADQLMDVDYTSIESPDELGQLIKAIKSTKPTSQDTALLDTLLGAIDVLLHIRPDSTAQWRNRAWVLSKLERDEEALDTIDKAIENGDDDGWVWRRRGWILGRLERYEDALDALDNALARNSEDGWTWGKRAWALGRLKRYQEALEASDKAVGYDGNNGWVWLNRGWTLVQLGRHEEAIPVLERALSITPDHPGTLHDLGVALERVGKLQEALNVYSRAIDLTPNDAHLWDHKGTLLSGMGEAQLAIEAFTRQVETTPESARANKNLGGELALLGRYQEALHCLERALHSEDEARTAVAVTVLAILLSACNQTEATLRTLRASQRASEVEPLVVALRLDLGETVDVAQEIEEVAKDILVEIEEIRALVEEDSSPD